MKNRKGFTLIELLAVIVILALLMAIAIPSVTKYIETSRKKTLTSTIDGYISAITNEVNNRQYNFSNANIIYALPIECIDLERGGNNPFGEWLQANKNYWAYVLIQYDNENFSYNYGFTFKDSAGYGLYPITEKKLSKTGKQIDLYPELTKPSSGKCIEFIEQKFWDDSGFKVTSETNLKVFLARDKGDSKNTCTIMRKGSNYDELEAERNKPGTLINNGTVFGKEISKDLIEAIYTLDYVSIPFDIIDLWDASNEQNESIMAWTIDKDNDGLYEVYLAQENGVKTPANSSNLFYNYINLEEIDLKNLDTSNTSKMVEMFRGDKKLKTLDLSSFDTSNVTWMSSMFKNCENLESINVSSFDTSKAYYMMAIFQGCKKLKSIDLSNFNTQSAGVMNYMFYGCTSLEEIDLSSFNPKKLTVSSYMFANCHNLKKINISNIDFSNVVQNDLMFYNVNSSTEIYVRDETQKEWITSKFDYLTNVKIYNED